MADVKWIKITTDIFDDEKILLIESLPDAYAIITVWFKLLCLAGKQNNSGVFLMGRIPYTDKMLATIFRMKEATVTMALQTFEQFGMVEIVDGVITIPNWNKHQTLDAYEKKKERDRLYQQERRANQRALIGKSSDTSSDTSPEKSSDVAFSEEDKDIEKELDIEKREKRESRKKKNIHTLFESLYSEYNLSDILIEKIRELITYKSERKENYAEQGMKSLLRQLENKYLEYGDTAICALIDECMANNWKGIIFDRLKDKPKKQGSFDTDSFYEAAVRNSLGGYENPRTIIEREAATRMSEGKNAKTAADDPDLKNRAETLRNKIAGKEF